MVNYIIYLTTIVIVCTFLAYCNRQDIVYIGGNEISYLGSLYDKYKDKEYFHIDDMKILSLFVNNSIGMKMQEFTFTPIGLYSMTNNKSNKTILSFINKNISSSSKKLVITDATACIGGNSIYFAMNFKHTNAVEIDVKNFTALSRNIELYKLSDKISLYNKDYLEIINDINQDIVFIDPPWGGIDYSKDKFIDDLPLSNVSLYDIINKLECIIVLKLPYNFNLSKLQLLDRSVTHIYDGKLLLVFINSIHQ